jgi:copper(I)-binding protein
MKIIKTFMLFIGFSVAGFAQADGHLMVDDGWVREAPPGAMALAGYMKLHNHADKNRVLVGAQSPAFESVMLHKTVIEGEMSQMVHQHMITIPARGMVSFEPNSYHLMMMKPKQPLKAGDKVSVTLSFKDGSTHEVTHEVRATMGGMGMDHSGHNMGHQH